MELQESPSTLPRLQHCTQHGPASFSRAGPGGDAQSPSQPALPAAGHRPHRPLQAAGEGCTIQAGLGRTWPRVPGTSLCTATPPSTHLTPSRYDSSHLSTLSQPGHSLTLLPRSPHCVQPGSGWTATGSQVDPGNHSITMAGMAGPLRPPSPTVLLWMRRLIWGPERGAPGHTARS